MFLAVILSLAFIMPVKAQYVIKEADAKYELFDYTKAVDLYEQAYREKQTLHATERLALCYSYIQNYKEAESWYAIAVNLLGSKPDNMLNYAKALQNNAKYNEAKQAYIKYAELNKQVTPAQKTIWILSCDSAAIWMKTPRQVTINNLKAINTAKSDWGALAYGNDIVFASDRNNMLYLKDKQKTGRPFLKFDGRHVPNKNIYGWTGNSYLHLYEQKGKLGDINLFPVTVKTDYHVGAASFTGNGNEIYFTLTRIPKKTEYNRKGNPVTINVEIYSCKKDSAGNWAMATAFKYNKVGEYSVGDPYISEDGKTLYFTSNMPGGKGGMDIYYCKKNEAGNWNAPVNLTAINTAGNERTPHFNSDSFYFSSDGLVGMGGLDIFKSILVNGKFSTPVNLGYPLNSARDDFAYNFDNSTTGYFASNRPDGLGSDDIYSFNVPKLVVLVFKLEGTAYDKNTRQPLSNAVISLTKVNGMPLKVQTDTDGRFKFDLDTSSTYNLTGEKTGFWGDSASASTVNLTTSTVIRKDLYLEKMELNKEIVLKNIYYDFDKSNIRPDAAKELDKLVKILDDNPTIWIELGSHTDSRGSDQYNMALSQRRADAAVKYIIDKGINKNRITAKGYGETRLVNGCSNGISCTVEQHQANRRTEFQIVKY
jgi:outer membrane protein OmpA-like peptidoglycan-associated protein/tetratricopeptide (TPR) repeat protein